MLDAADSSSSHSSLTRLPSRKNGATSISGNEMHGTDVADTDVEDDAFDTVRGKFTSARARMRGQTQSVNPASPCHAKPKLEAAAARYFGTGTGRVHQEFGPYI